MGNHVKNPQPGYGQVTKENSIKNMDVQNEYLYVLDEDNYSLYIFSLKFRQPRFVKSKELAKRWWLLCLDDIPAKVLQFQYPFGRNKYSAIHVPLMAQRNFLQLHPSTSGIIRSTNEFLVTTASEQVNKHCCR